MRIVKESPRLRPHANGGLPTGDPILLRSGRFTVRGNAMGLTHMRRSRRALAAAAMLGMVGGSLATMGTANAAVMVSGSTIDSAGNYVDGNITVFKSTTRTATARSSRSSTTTSTGSAPGRHLRHPARRRHLQARVLPELQRVRRRVLPRQGRPRDGRRDHGGGGRADPGAVDDRPRPERRRCRPDHRRPCRQRRQRRRRTTPSRHAPSGPTRPTATACSASVPPRRSSSVQRLRPRHGRVAGDRVLQRQGDPGDGRRRHPDRGGRQRRRRRAGSRRLHLRPRDQRGGCTALPREACANSSCDFTDTPAPTPSRVSAPAATRSSSSTRSASTSASTTTTSRSTPRRPQLVPSPRARPSPASTRPWPQCLRPLPPTASTSAARSATRSAASAWATRSRSTTPRPTRATARSSPRRSATASGQYLFAQLDRVGGETEFKVQVRG